MRMCKCAAVLLSLLLLCACTDTSWAVGCWKTDDPSGYYFELYDDGRCVMFDAADAWVSEGTYTVRGRRLHFKTDTGRFTWQKTEHGMAFDNGSTTLQYYLSE
ncbi:MAG: hypothetical protein IJC52_03170 [Clostridia bacterium]|nr:hypothetical protein [Clostridia bacterium]